MLRGGWREYIGAITRASAARRLGRRRCSARAQCRVRLVPLRRKEDDFSFSKKEEKLAPSDHLDAIMKEGSRLGLHVMAWCDTVNNLNRHFTNQVLREFEMRVLFQMSPSDSGHLLDSPQASKLGPNRALFVSEDQNRLEKFRPYGIPAPELLKRISEGLGASGKQLPPG